MFNYYGIDWLAQIFILLGTFLIANKIYTGWLVCGLGSIASVVFGIMAESVATAMFGVVFLIVNLIGYKNNKKPQ